MGTNADYYLENFKYLDRVQENPVLNAWSLINNIPSVQDWVFLNAWSLNFTLQ